MSRFLAALPALAFCCAHVAAHEVRPAYLGIEAAADGHYEVLFKRPLTSAAPLPLVLRFPPRCETVSAAADATPEAFVQRFKLACAGGLRGETVAVDGLAAAITDVMLHVTLADGTQMAAMLRPAKPAVVIGESAAPALAYLALGVEHLLLGVDHILFVLALMYFLRRAADLVKAVTAFTVSHSITLALSALELVRLPQAPVEAVIALSILFLAVEKQRGGKQTLTARHTWLVAFAFGLLHGFGFAGALADIGLPKQNLLLALLLFNAGVEVGQLAVIAVALAFVAVVRRAPVIVPRHLVRAPLYASGCLAAYWFVARTATIVSIP